MKIVIDIPKKTYEHIKADGGHGCFNIQEEDNFIVTKAIFDGTPLPKGHGRLIDAEKLSFNADTCRETTDAFVDLISEAPTILESDREDKKDADSD